MPVVADNNSSSNEFSLIRITCIAWLAAKMISWKLWISYRIFPMLPVFDFSSQLPDIFHFILFGISLIGIVLVFFFPQKKQLVLSVIAVEILSCILDQMRWQPWEYQYLMTFIFFFYYHKKATDFIKLLAILIGATYIFSGLHKFSISFLDTIWSQMILKSFFGFSTAFIETKAVQYFGLLMGVVEVFTGIGLLFLRNKKLFIYLALVMHGFLLLVLGPLGISFNKVIWPWNIAMMPLVWILFYNNTFSLTTDLFKPIFNKLIIVFVGILPVLNFFGLWDNNLSFNLYSGKSKRAFICSEKMNGNDQLKPYVSNNYVTQYCSENSTSISINKLALLELNVPLHPEERTYKAIKRAWIKKYPDDQNTFVVYDYPYKTEDIREIE